MKTLFLSLFIFLSGTCFSQTKDTVVKEGKIYRTSELLPIGFKKSIGSEGTIYYVSLSTESSVEVSDSSEYDIVILFCGGSKIERNGIVHKESRVIGITYDASFVLTLKESMQFKTNIVKSFRLRFNNKTYEQVIKNGQSYINYFNALISAK